MEIPLLLCVKQWPGTAEFQNNPYPFIFIWEKNGCFALSLVNFHAVCQNHLIFWTVYMLLYGGILIWCIGMCVYDPLYIECTILFGKQRQIPSRIYCNTIRRTAEPPTRADNKRCLLGMLLEFLLRKYFFYFFIFSLENTSEYILFLYIKRFIFQMNRQIFVVWIQI